jgi:hypothetical protein
MTDRLVWALVFFLGVLGVTAGAGEAAGRSVPFTNGNRAWDASAFGNHRVVVRVEAPGTAARVVVPWRRRDPHPERVQIIVVDGAAGVRVARVRRGDIGRERGELWFEPTSGPGRYYLYYLPYVLSGTNYPRVTYVAADEADRTGWEVPSTGVVDAVVEEVQSIDDFHGFSAMEVIATEAETSALVARAGRPAYLVFPEDRLHPIRMRDRLPLRWVDRGAGGTVEGEARRGEYFAFQLGIYALSRLTDVRVRFGALAGPGAAAIPETRLDCLNGHGTNWDGRRFTTPVNVDAGTVQALWCAIDVPRTTAPGRYTGTATVVAAGQAETLIPIAVTVTAVEVFDGGASEPWKQTRLGWLNSTLAQKNDVIAPYTPLEVRGTTIRLLGREVVIGPLGLPAEIRTFFAPEMTRLSDRPARVLAAPAAFTPVLASGAPASFEATGPTFTDRTAGTVRWEASGRAGALSVKVAGSLEFDGFMSVAVALTAEADTSLQDVALDLPYAREAATHMMGLGLKGGRRPSSLEWRWDVATKNQDGAWIGGVNAGLSFSLRGDNYVRPLNTNFYLQKPLLLPSSWGNEGKGGISIGEVDGTVRVRGYSGARVMRAGETQHFNLVALVTPFHLLDTDFQWRTRFYHRYADPDAIAATGATVVNVHHATPVNPWINYPFIAHREMKDYVDRAHAKGLLVKIYNTVRELSNRAYELFPLRSLGHEIFSPGPGGGFSWLQEHLGDDYIPAWFVPEIQDAAVINSGMSRWHNYYVEGMRWLVQHVGIAGIYLDDVAFDRTTMKRIKRVLTEGGRPGIVDLHSANQFNRRDGFVNSAVLYLEHFPYLNRLWFGEYFDYEANSPDFFLTEVSGIPFGLMGEMLEGGGNPWRGMVYGMTNRMPWNEKSDPRPIWRVWDAFGMQGTEMIGYWVPSPPVRTDRADVLATVFKKPGAALVALASWADGDVDARLAIDWGALGLDPARTTIEAPEVRAFQPARRFTAGEAVPVARGQGWLLVLREERR